MDKLKNIKILILFFTLIGLSLSSLAKQAADGFEEEVREQEEMIKKMNDCQLLASRIKYFCSENEAFKNAQQKREMWNMVQKEIQSRGLSTVEKTIKETATAQEQLAHVTEVCKEAHQQCTNRCKTEYQELDKKRQANPAAAFAYQQQMQQVQNHARACQAEAQKTAAAAGGLGGDLSGIMGMLQSLLGQMGGKGGGSGSGGTFSAAAESGECDGPLGNKIIDCMEKTGPKNTRGGLSGSNIASLGKKLNGDPFAAAGQDDPKALQETSLSDDPGLGNGFNAAAMGGLGGLPGGSNGVNDPGSSGEEASGFDANIHRGYMGTNGGSGGGYSGSSKGAAVSASGFGNYALEDPRATKKAMLRKKLAEFTASGATRAPASNAETAGPFEENWEVITNAYKKAARSMFHKE